MERINIDLNQKSYDILIGKNILQNIENLIDDNKETNFIITDSKVDTLYGNKLSTLTNFHKVVIEPGEVSKSIDTTITILKQMLIKGLSRKSMVIAFGGGVVGDLAGFCSSIYMRGISFVQIPTTLLAQVDSSVGGKTGVNLLEYKNSVGTFYQPSKVIIDTELLKSLPYKELLSGIGEIIKYGIIYDYSFFQYIVKEIENIKSLDPDVINYVIKRCCEIKAEIISQDEKEEDLRKILNFGHTIGHGLEGITNFSKYTHGEAIIIGMYTEILLAQKLDLIDNDYALEILSFLETLGVDLNISSYPKAKLIECILHDKKNIKDKISFIFPVSPGKVKEIFLEKEYFYDD